MANGFVVPQLGTIVTKNYEIGRKNWPFNALKPPASAKLGRSAGERKVWKFGSSYPAFEHG